MAKLFLNLQILHCLGTDLLRLSSVYYLYRFYSLITLRIISFRNPNLNCITKAITNVCRKHGQLKQIRKIITSENFEMYSFRYKIKYF